jgi:tetratricopeptide (TPR) repeat protein
MAYLLSKGIQFIRDAENEKAIKILQQVLKEDPHNSEVHRHLGLAFFNLGNYSRAKAHWNTSVELEPEHHQTWWNLGQVNELLNDFEKAIEAYEKAVLSADKVFPEKAIRYREWVKKAQANRNHFLSNK